MVAIRRKMNGIEHHERGLIGSLLVRPDLMVEAASIVTDPKMIFHDGIQRIYAAMIRVSAEGAEPDANAVMGHFATRGGLDPELRAAIIEAAEFVPSGINAVWHAKAVRKGYRDRESRAKQARLADLRNRGADAATIAEAVVDLNAWLDDSRVEEQGRKFKDSKEAIGEFIGRVRRGEEELLQLGITELDRALSGGVGFGEFVVFSAPSNHCKSSLALQAVHYCSAHGIRCLVISAEMSGHLLGKRTLQTMLDGMAEHDYAANVEALEAAAYFYQEHREPWFIDDEAGNLDEVLASIDQAVKRNGVRFVALDYLQMIECRAGNKFESVSRVSSALRDKAKQHKIVLLALCQMNNNIMKRPKFQPKVSDIEYGPQIFKDADTVIFGIWPHRVDDTRPSDKYDFYLAKNRNRPILRGVIQVNWDASRQTFYDLSHKERNKATGNEFAGAFDDMGGEQDQFDFK